MNLRSLTRRLQANEELNFLLTNRIPRHALTRFMGWFSKLTNPLVRVPSIALWRFFCDADLTDSEKRRFASLHDAFTRALRSGARQFAGDMGVISSPCDAIVGACGTVDGGQAFQLKGMDYGLADLLADAELAAELEGATFVTLRLTAGMYHRFHAPCDIVVEEVRYISGDCWNVNPPALKRIERLYCRNERAPILARMDGSSARLVLVPVAAVLVASIRLPFVDPRRPIRERHARIWKETAKFSRGEEMGWFEHGSTIVLFAPPGYVPCAQIHTGEIIRAGDDLLKKS